MTQAGARTDRDGRRLAGNSSAKDRNSYRITPNKDMYPSPGTPVEGTGHQHPNEIVISESIESCLTRISSSYRTFGSIRHTLP
eukprot:1663492-Rhodomonas_salina.1